MVLTTHEMRLQLAPHCTVKPHPGAQDAWNAHQMVMRWHAYELRKKDTGSRNCREITGNHLPADDPDSWSLHAYFIDCVINLWNLGVAIAAAAALDSNWETNPYGPKLITDRPRAMCDDIEAIRTVNGKQVFRWGGHYAGNKDSMHDELVCAMVDLATGIDWSTVRGHPSHPDSTPVQEDDMYDDTLDKAIEKRLAEQPQGGMFDFAGDGGDRSVVWLEAPGHGEKGPQVLVQRVSADGKYGRRLLHEGCVGAMAGPFIDDTRIDVLVQLAAGGVSYVTYDPNKPGDLPGGWHAVDKP